jgi:hypothetical protein
MLTVMASLKPVVAAMMLRRQPAMKTPVVAAGQTIVMRPVMAPLQPVVLPIMAILQAIMATIMGRRIALVRDRRGGQAERHNRQQRLYNVSMHSGPPLQLP